MRKDWCWSHNIPFHSFNASIAAPTFSSCACLHQPPAEKIRPRLRRVWVYNSTACTATPNNMREWEKQHVQSRRGGRIQGQVLKLSGGWQNDSRLWEDDSTDEWEVCCLSFVALESRGGFLMLQKSWGVTTGVFFICFEKKKKSGYARLEHFKEENLFPSSKKLKEFLYFLFFSMEGHLGVQSEQEE